MKTYNAIIIGAGSIGALKPDKFDSPTTQNILTIAHAFYSHPRINLFGIYDTDKNKMHKAAKKWGTIEIKNIHDFFMLNDIDMLAICSSTETHFKVIRDILIKVPWKRYPKIILVEKPFCSNSLEVKKILTMAHPPIAIDYSRRYDKALQLVKEEIVKKRTGEIYSCTVHYERGLQRDGCHAIDICNFLFGGVLLEKSNGRLNGLSYEDYSKKDITYPVHLAYEKCGNVFLIPNDGRAYSMFEVDILCQKGRFRFTEHGLTMELYTVGKEKTYGNYNALNKHPLKFETELNKSLLNYVDNSVNFLDTNGKTKLLCTAEDAIKQHEVYEFLMRGKK